MRWDLEGPISWGYLAHCSHLFFMSIRIEFLASYSMLFQSVVTQTSLDRLYKNTEFCQCLLRRSCQLQLFDTCSRLCASAASACNWASYRTYDVMVLECTHYITCITLNVSQTGCTIASQLGFQLCLMV